MSTVKSWYSVTAGATALALSLLTGCSSTMPASDLPAQCPEPPRPDQRLLVAPCAFLAADGNPADTLQIGVVTGNNQCARQIRDNYIELQNWTKEQLSNATH